jgi:hypothetical protein
MRTRVIRPIRAPDPPPRQGDTRAVTTTPLTHVEQAGVTPPPLAA